MKPIYENTTTYTYEQIKDYYHYTFFIKHRISLIAFCTYMGLFFIFSIIMFCIKNFSIGIPFFILSIVIVGIRLSYPTIFSKRIIRNASLSNTLKNTFTFQDTSFQVSNAMDNTEVEYSKLVSIEEYNNMYYLYLDKDNAYLIDQSQFSIGENSSFYSFLYDKIKKYHK